MKTADLHDVTKLVGYGDRIPNSAFYRAFCPECLTPVRVTEGKIFNTQTIFCEICNPPHIGCTSPPSPIDYDAIGSGAISTQHDYHGVTGE